jgi:hypothetical protein
MNAPDHQREHKDREARANTHQTSERIALLLLREQNQVHGISAMR